MRKRWTYGKSTIYQGEHEVLRQLAVGKKLISFNNGFVINGVFYSKIVVERLAERGYLDERLKPTESGKVALARAMKIVKPLRKKAP